MNTRKMRMAALVLAVCLSGTAQAALQGRDLNGSIDSFEAYYDTDLNITWLADANYAKTSGIDPVGTIRWADANTWVANLSFTDGVNVYDNWRLPTTLQPDASCSGQASNPVSYGYGCSGSELGHLFYTEFGGVAGSSIADTHNANYSLFQNFQVSYYGSSTESIPGDDSVWNFYFVNGHQEAYNKLVSFYVLPVSPGDVGIAAIPEPETYAMMLAGLLFIGFAMRHRSKNHS